MRKNFKYALSEVLKSEGGYSDHPRDPGGATMKGITLITYNNFSNGGKTKADLREITDKEIHDIYLAGYWAKCHCDYLPAGVDFTVFDACVNSGVVRATRWLQQVVDVKIDGLFGPKTLSAVNSFTPCEIISVMCYIRLQFLRELKTWDDFGKGWGRRVLRVKAESLKMGGNND